MAFAKPDDLLAIAHLVRAHGIQGEISAIPLAPPVLDPVGLIEDRVLTLRDPGGATRTVRGLGVRFHQDRWLISLEGVESIDDVEHLRGVDLCLRREELPVLPEGWYWEDDLLQCRVLDARLGEIGQAAGLSVKAYQPQLELKRLDGSIVLIPWVRAYIAQVDLEQQLIRTDLPDGYPGISDMG